VAAKAANATRVYCIFTINIKNIVDLIEVLIFITKVINKLYLCTTKKLSNTFLVLYVTELLITDLKK
jgi:hypothetical protein